MASRLSKATKHARKGLIIFLIFAIATFVFRFIFELTGEDDSQRPGATIDTSTGPYLARDGNLGKIPRPNIKRLQLSPNSSPTTSIIDQQILPEKPDTVYVYYYNKPREKLGNTAKGRSVANRLNFTSLERLVSDTELLWQSDDLSRTLTYDKLKDIWSYETDLTRETIPDDIRKNIATVRETDYYEETGIDVISKLGLRDHNFNRGESRIDYINIVNSEIKSAPSPSTSQFVRIAQHQNILASKTSDRYRPEEGEVLKTDMLATIRKPDYLNGSATMIVRGEVTNLVPYLVNFDYTQLNIGDSGIYKMLSVTDAYVRIQAGEGILYWLKLINTNPFSDYEPLAVLEFEIDASKTQVIYIEPYEWIESEPWTNYLQPYYLFEGIAILEDGREADFAVILPALTDDEYLQ